MYSDFINQFVHLTRYMLAFVLVFVVWPAFLFKKHDSTLLENFFSGFIKIVLLIIVLGYILVLTKLFELLSVVIILLGLSFRRYLERNAIANWDELIDNINILIYKISDGIIHPSRVISKWFNTWKEQWKTRIKSKMGSISSLGTALLIVIVFAYSAYLRFYDATVHAAPALSDAYTTLAWMKHIDSRILFYHDGGEIYPRGFHIILAVIYKFSAIDPLYVLRYTGPFIGVLIILGMYFTVSRLTKSTISGVIAAAVYGIGGMLLPTEWERQASTNSQEFAFIFVVPAIYFLYKYLKHWKKEDFITASAGLMVTGLVHQLVFAYTAIGIAILALSSLITDVKDTFRKIPYILLSGVVSALVSLMPFGIGKLMGFKSHGSSVDFLTSRSKTSMPSLAEIGAFDRFLLVCLACVFVYLIINVKHWKELLAEKFIVLLGLAAFAIYFWGGALTQSTMVESRAGEFWSLVIPCCVGMGWHVVGQLIPSDEAKKLTGLILCLIFTGYIFFHVKPSPIIPYKMHSDAVIEQYLRISRTFRPKSWWLVSSNYEDFAIVLGRGFSIKTRVLMDTYDPKSNPLAKRGEVGPDEALPEDIFIFYEKNIFKVNETNSIYPIEKPEYERREKEKEELRQWLQEYQNAHDNISIFYEDDNLTVYHIHIPRSKEMKFRDLWER